MQINNLKLVSKVGLEPTRLAPPPPQDGVSTNSTTPTFNFLISQAYLFYFVIADSTDQV